MGAEHDGVGIVDHVFSEAHASDRVVLKFAEGGGAEGALAGPVLVVGAPGEFIAAFRDAWAVLEKGGHCFARFLGEALGLFVSAWEAHGVFEDAFGSFEDLGDGVGVVDFLKIAIASKAGRKGFVVLEGVEERGDFAHAQEWFEIRDLSNVFRVGLPCWKMWGLETSWSVVI